MARALFQPRTVTIFYYLRSGWWWLLLLLCVLSGLRFPASSSSDCRALGFSIRMFSLQQLPSTEGVVGKEAEYHQWSGRRALSGISSLIFWHRICVGGRAYY